MPLYFYWPLDPLDHLLNCTIDGEFGRVGRDAGRVGGRAGVVAAMLEVQPLDDQRAWVLVVAADRDGIREPGGAADVEQRGRPEAQPWRDVDGLAVLAPLESDRKTSLKDLEFNLTNQLLWRVYQKAGLFATQKKIF